MDENCLYIPYKDTGYFSKIVIDYLQQDEKLQPFYQFPPTNEGIKQAIENRKNYSVDRQLLVSQLREQYKNIPLTERQQHNLDSLLSENTFTFCTAHQPNIFTGHLYFIYKILHVIKLADHYKNELTGYDFVPVFYMGSEDADLDELGHVNILGEKLEWQTQQTGAVGRMKVDKAFIALIDRIEGMIGVLPYGNDVVAMFRRAYVLGSNIQDATLILVNELFKEFGLLVLIPDNAALKAPFTGIVKRELTEQFSYPLVQAATEKIDEHYKVQAGGREINLFYLTEDKRERIEKLDDKFVVQSLGLSFSESEIVEEAEQHPERFSANVILRGVFQEMILPNIAFVGGGGELAYWLELKEVFETCNVPFPVLLLRNSFVLVNEKQKELVAKTGFELKDMFKSHEALVNELVKRESNNKLHVDNERAQGIELYDQLKEAAENIDPTLIAHIESLEKKFQKQLTAVERKMLRAEKKNMEVHLRQVGKWKEQLFPGNSLQERVDNFAEYYATYGKSWLQYIYNASQTISEDFVTVVLE